MVWNPGDDSDLNEGGAGTDTTEVNGGNGAEAFTATANGARVRFDRINPAPFAIDIGTTENLVVNMNGGDDNFSATGNLASLIKITVDGGAGNDTILGSNGADVLLGGDGNDFVDGGDGNDVAIMGAGNDIFVWNPGDDNDTIEGQAGTDTMLFNGSNVSENIDLSANGGRLRFFRNIANVVMDTNDLEQVDFNALGGADNITVNDLSGTDVKQVNLNLAAPRGGGDAQAHTVIANGTNGNNTIQIQGSGDSYSVVGLPTSIAVDGSEGANDSLVINALGGNDVVNASTLTASVVRLTVDGGIGNDTIQSGSSADVLLGGDGNDTLDGGAGNDSLNGGAGNDLLIGGLGTDTLTGGTGQDQFRFNAPAEGVDTITDFVAVDDSIQVKASSFGGGLTVGAISAGQFHLGSAAADINDRFIYDNGALFFDIDGTGGAAQVKLAMLTGAPTIAAADIVVV